MSYLKSLALNPESSSLLDSITLVQNLIVLYCKPINIEEIPISMIDKVLSYFNVALLIQTTSEKISSNLNNILAEYNM